MRYADGVYLDNTYTAKMTTSANPIATLPQRTGYTFAGYYDGSTQMIDATGKITSAFTNTKYSAAKTLNAHWTANTYTVTYDDNRFDTYSVTKNGLTITYDSGNHELTINGTQSATITLQNVLHNFIEGDEYKATLTYISGTVSSSDDSNYLLCNDVRSADASSIQMQYCLKPPATSVNTVTKTITADAATNGKILYTMLWVASSNKVTYTNYKMKVDFTKVQTKSVTYNSTYGTLPTPTRTGYTFNGWYTAESGGTQVTTSSPVTATSNHTLYAHWTVNTYTVTYDDNRFNTYNKTTNGVTVTYTEASHQVKLSGTHNGSVYLQTASHNFVEGEVYRITLTYVSGSYTSTTRQMLCLQLMKQGNVDMPSLRQICPYLPTSDNPTTTASLTITADDVTNARVLFNYIWAETSGALTYSDYVIKVDVTRVDSKSVTYNSEYGTLPTPTRIGYTFNGWYTAESGGTQVTSSTLVTNANNHTLYAHWTKNSYSINYTLNGGSYGTNHPTSKTYDTPVTINNPTKTVTVTGNANGTGASVGSATSATQTFDGWTSNADTNTAKYGTYVTQIKDAWTNTSTKVKAAYFNDLTPTNNGSVTMTANWTPVAVTLPTLSKTGHTCNYYTTSGTSGGSLMGAGGASWTPGATSNAAVTAYARCSANQYTITYNANGGSGAPSATTYTYATSGTTNLSSTKPTRTGYTFLGWSTSSTATSASYSAGQAWNLSNANNYLLYAVWSVNSYTITYNANGGSGAPSATTYTYATSGTTNLSSTKPTRTGYTFLGWSTSSTATSASYSAGQAWNLSNASNYTLYAVWQVKSITCSAGNYLPASSETCSQCPANSYCSGGTWTYDGSAHGRTLCSSLANGSYTTSAAGSDASNDCYIPKSNLSGKYVATANAAPVTCAAGGYCPGTSNVAYGSTGGRNLCSSLANGSYTTSPAGSDATNDCYIPKANLSGKYVATANAAPVTCAAGGYCPGTSNISYGSTGGRIECDAGTYNGNTGSTELSACTACIGNIKYSAKGASACSIVSTGYFATGCNSSFSNCTGQQQCPAGSYCRNGRIIDRCPAGSYSAAGSTRCTVCGAGKTSDPGSTSSSSCSSCPNSTYVMTWFEPSWQNDNVVNLCIARTCKPGHFRSGFGCT